MVRKSASFLAPSASVAKKRPASCLAPTEDVAVIPPLYDDANPFPRTYAECRKVMKVLDKRPPHTVYHMDDSRSLTPSQMEQFYTRRRNHMVGSIELKQWERDITLPTEDQVGAGYYFAHYKGEKLPRTFLDGIKSAVDKAEFDEVVLIHYTKPKNVPDGVVELDARAFLPLVRFNYLLGKGFRLVHLADWIRVMGMEATTHKRAVFVDGDTIWLKKALPKQTHCGFWFGSFAENKVMAEFVSNMFTDK